jgi:hypothetical protein
MHNILKASEALLWGIEEGGSYKVKKISKELLAYFPDKDVVRYTVEESYGLNFVFWVDPDHENGEDPDDKPLEECKIRFENNTLHEVTENASSFTQAHAF